MKNFFSTLMFVVILLSGIDAFSNQKSSIPYDGVVVAWKPVDGAIGYRVEIKNSMDQKIASLDVDTSRIEYKLPEGKYYVRIGALNRFKKVDSFSDWSLLEVVESFAPVIKNISVSAFFAGEYARDISLRGNHIKDGTSIFIENKNGKIIGNKFRYISDNEVMFDLDLDDALPGKYNLVVENPAGQRAVKEKFMLIKKTAVDLSKLPAGSAYLATGWEYSYLVSDWAEVYDNSFLSFRLTAGFNLRAFDAVKSMPVLSSVSIEGDFIYASYESLSRPGIVDTALNQYITGINICWCIAFPADFTMAFRAGSGGVFSSFTEKRAFGESKNFSSRDFFWRAGVSFQYDIWADIFAEAGIDYVNIIYSGNSFQNIKAGMRVGYRI